MLNTFKKARIRFPVVFYEEIDHAFKKKIDTKIEIVLKFPVFSFFLQLWLHFQQTSWIRTLKTVNKARTRIPVVYYEEINAVF